ncbi:MAG TPA: Gfo/Idh/MocA family oxidoreductase [Candidatus Hydrogenedentes bacterium]|nr:Gfo/Idh/MocA family oxidoreductase [Candidatus Hydrogenedentota bacterium]
MNGVRTNAAAQNRCISRRSFLGATTAATAFAIVPRHVIAGADEPAPSEKLNMAFIGVGWQGIYNLRTFLAMPDVQVVAVCDVNAEGPYMGRGQAGREVGRRVVNEHYGEENCGAYADFREMLDVRDDIDAVVITTPDHVHAVAAMAAIKKGMHVFCEKPLAHSLYEVRTMTEAARAAGVATQLGNWGHAKEDIRLLCEWIWDGAIGEVREVHAWTNRPGGWWPYGIDRPEDKPPMPEGLDWDLWLGPAPERPYHPAYLPFIWRGWWDFGCGALGDMGCHILDPAKWALKLGSPDTVEASSTKLNSEATPFGPEMPAGQVHPETTTASAIVRWTFPARGDLPPVTVIWHDGGLMPPRPDELESGRQMGNRDGGALFIGDKAKLICGCYGESPRLLPESKMKAYTLPPKSLPRSIGHYKEFVRACKGGEPAGANFDYGGPLTEIVQLGIAAIRADAKLQWDPTAMEFTNHPDANRLVNPLYRDGWSL